jgi:hypothetical protein
MTRAALASACATGGVERARTESKPAAAASWRMLRAVKRCLVREVTVADVPSERADGVRDPVHEDAAGRQCRGHGIERLENLWLGEVL